MGLGGAILAASVVGAGTSMLGASKASKASQKATDAQIAAQKAQYDQTRADLQPYVQSGYKANNALLGRLGLANPAPATSYAAAPSTGNALATPPASAPLTAPIAGVDPSQAGNYNPLVGKPLPAGATDTFQSTGLVTPATPSAGLAKLATNGAAPMPAVPDQGAGIVTPDSAPAGTDLVRGADGAISYAPHSGGQISADQAQAILAQRPDVANSDWLKSLDANTIGDRTGDGQVTAEDRAAYWYDNYGKPEGMALPAAAPAPPPPDRATQSPADLTGNPYSYGNVGDPKFSDPGFHYNAADYTASPAYQYTVDQAMKGVLAHSAATGALKSGAALKALQDRASQLAYQDFGAERNFARASYDTDRAFNYGNYTDQRNYLTNRADTQTRNLFDLSSAGQNAAAQTGTFGANATNGIVNALGSNAVNQGNAAIAGANATTSLLGSATNALAYSRGFGGGYSSPMGNIPASMAGLY